jgi:hypothetical protein
MNNQQNQEQPTKIDHEQPTKNHEQPTKIDHEQPTKIIKINHQNSHFNQRQHCKITNYSYDRNRAVTNSKRVRKDDELIIHL